MDFKHYWNIFGFVKKVQYDSAPNIITIKNFKVSHFKYKSRYHLYYWTHINKKLMDNIKILVTTNATF